MHPVLFYLGPWPVYTYGFFVSLGVGLALVFLQRAAGREGMSRAEVLDLVLFFTFFSFLGARLFFVIQFLGFYWTHPLDVFRVWEGGIVFYGGVIAGLVFLWFYSRRKKWPYLKVTDFLAPYVFLAHAFGRIGCFFTGCCYGREAGVPWAVRYPFLSYPVHPTQLYESAANFVLFFFLLRRHRSKKFDGETTLAYLILYGAERFVLENFRGDNPLLWGFTLPQWVSLSFVVLASLTYLLYFRNRHAEKGN
ncbi:MAG: prolipoprotein diacylglyceryl transferase [Candidatus Omnitrophica bacterium]|nr:prolipoprotein diacylglyceryl transferase [Candidatus Omnitrophota bacterium]